ncbi:MAG: 16S rRNA (guanine(527)-N(7))-methyltransferase RsmG, partial [Dehalococcoidia bacterium]
MSGSSDEGRRLRCGAEQLGIDLSEQAAAKLIAFLECLYLWNKSAGLTTIERSEAVRLHLLDSLTALPLLGRCVAIADLGSGPGLPGIPLAIALPASRLVLVESRRRKCSFLAETIRELGLENCRVEQADARRYGGSPRLD